jgi:UDP-N-acetylmuramate dehydrogenase
MISLEEIRQSFRGLITLNEPLGRFTWMKVGGPADYYVEPADVDDLRTVLSVIREKNLPFLLLGRGSNMLVSDAGYRGVVINLEEGLSTVEMDGELVRAEAGVRTTKFVDFCVQHSLAGVEMLAGIPGTIGGAVRMNAGAHGGETADHLEDVDVLQENEVKRIPKAECEFGYRHSRIRGDVVVGARFRLETGESEELVRRRKELIQKRNATQPLDLPNLGSMFKNPPGIHAAELIEKAGLKGKRIGDAQISEKHANFMVNHGAATAAEVMQLVGLVQKTVEQQAGVALELEITLVGFDAHGPVQ